MYRHMWSFFKDDKISAFQSNYREYIKGIKLITGAPGQEQPLAYDGFEKVLLPFCLSKKLNLHPFRFTLSSLSSLL